MFLDDDHITLRAILLGLTITTGITAIALSSLYEQLGAEMPRGELRVFLCNVLDSVGADDTYKKAIDLLQQHFGGQLDDLIGDDQSPNKGTK